MLRQVAISFFPSSVTEVTYKMSMPLRMLYLYCRNCSEPTFRSCRIHTDSEIEDVPLGNQTKYPLLPAGGHDDAWQIKLPPTAREQKLPLKDTQQVR